MAKPLNRRRWGGNRSTRRKPLSTSFRKCHILKLEDSSPKRDSNPRSSTERGFATHRGTERGFATHRGIERGFTTHRGIERGFATHIGIERGFATHRGIERGFATHRGIERGFATHKGIERGFATHKGIERGFATLEADALTSRSMGRLSRKGFMQTFVNIEGKGGVIQEIDNMQKISKQLHKMARQ